MTTEKEITKELNRVPSKNELTNSENDALIQVRVLLEQIANHEIRIKVLEKMLNI